MSPKAKTSAVLVTGLVIGSAGTAGIVQRDPAYQAVHTAKTAITNTTSNPQGPRLINVVEHESTCMEGIVATAVHGDEDNPQPLSGALLEVLVKDLGYRQHVVTRDDGRFVLPLPAGESIDIYFVGFVSEIADEYPATQFVRIQSFAPPGGCVPLYSQP
jgi:hypothetical protein